MNMNLSMEEILRHRKIRPTAMRLLVLDYLTEQDKAVSLADVQHSFGKLDKSTVYRTLRVFEEKKLVHRIEDGTGHTKYALCREECECLPCDIHFHYHCTGCHKTVCLTSGNIPVPRLPEGFDVTEANLVLKGLCAKCSVKKTLQPNCKI